MFFISYSDREIDDDDAINEVNNNDEFPTKLDDDDATNEVNNADEFPPPKSIGIKATTGDFNFAVSMMNGEKAKAELTVEEESNKCTFMLPQDDNKVVTVQEEYPNDRLFKDENTTHVDRKCLQASFTVGEKQTLSIIIIRWIENNNSEERYKYGMAILG